MLGVVWLQFEKKPQPSQKKVLKQVAANGNLQFRRLNVIHGRSMLSLFCRLTSAGLLLSLILEQQKRTLVEALRAYEGA
jgi:hypothetical protein